MRQKILMASQKRNIVLTAEHRRIGLVWKEVPRVRALPGTELLGEPK